MLKFVIMFSLVSTIGASQTTWGGLKFGMLEAEARAVLKSRSIKDIRAVKEEQPEQKARLDAVIKVMDVKVDDLSGTANLLFDAKSKRLAEIGVTLSFEDSMTAGSRSAREGALIEDLSGKYGKATIDYHCGDFGLVCNAIWKNGSQVIELIIIRTPEQGSTWADTPKNVFIRYTLASKVGDI